MAALDLNKYKGITEKKAEERLKSEGYNELPLSKKRSIFAIAFEVVKEPMFLLLVACGSIYFVLGDLQEGLMLMSFVLVVMGITIYQERKTERALEALRDLSSPRALVIRDGNQRRIAGREVVREDNMILIEGDRVPTDAVVLDCVNLLVDESLLTGESVPVRKIGCDGKVDMGDPGGDDQPYVFSGTLVVSGQGVALVKKTGAHTQLGKIGKALRDIEEEETTLQRQTGRLVRNLALIGLTLCAIIAIVFGLTRGNWLGGLLAGITLAMATLPEEFPVVLTIFLSLGAWRMSKKNVLTRRMPAIETLGSATVLCTDKTGTLTQNKMTITKIFSSNDLFDVNSKKTLPEHFHELVEFSVLAAHPNPFDPMDKAIRQLGLATLENTDHIHDDWQLIQEYSLSRELLALSNVWQSRSSENYVIAAKGAPEAIADLCHFDKIQMFELEEQIAKLAADGLRVLGVAKAHFKKTTLPQEQHDFSFEFLGLLGFQDPIRETVPDAIRECYGAGLRVIMITGDYPVTAQNIARQIGLESADKFITGQELQLMTDIQLRDRIKDTSIFARVVPEQKLRIVTALKENGEIVAMTGDGVNDAPALKAAHIGIAMGERGTDVAREASSLVLLNDNFTSIVGAVRMGRRIYDNLIKAMAYILAVHIPIAGMSLLPVIFGWELVLLPVHIVFLELIIDPACSVVFEVEPEEHNIMKRLPRNPKEPMFGGKTIMLAIFQGLFVLAIVLVVYALSYFKGHNPAEARALSFTTLIFSNLALIVTNRSWTKNIFKTFTVKNNAFWFVIGGAILFLFLVLYIPFLRNLFSFNLLHFEDLLIAFGAGMFSVLWFEVVKMIGIRKRK